MARQLYVNQYYIFLVICIIFETYIVTTSANEQQTALATFYSAMSGASWPADRWNFNQPYCSYSGIQCSSNADVIGISLNSNNLLGTLPPSDVWKSLRFIQKLKFSNNYITGLFPPSYFDGTLAEIKIIDLKVNQLSGNLPALSITLASSLKMVDISGNQLSTLDWENWTSFLKVATTLTYCSLEGNCFGNDSRCNTTTILTLQCGLMCTICAAPTPTPTGTPSKSPCPPCDDGYTCDYITHQCQPPSDNNSTSITYIGIVVAVVVGVAIILGILALFFYLKKKKTEDAKRRHALLMGSASGEWGNIDTSHLDLMGDHYEIMTDDVGKKR